MVVTTRQSASQSDTGLGSSSNTLRNNGKERAPESQRVKRPLEPREQTPPPQEASDEEGGGASETSDQEDVEDHRQLQHQKRLEERIRRLEARKERAQTIQALEDRIDELEREAESNASPTPTPLPEAAPLPHYRPPKTRELRTYRGKSLREADNFFYDAELKWKEDQGYTWRSDDAKITHCVSAFEGLPKEMWRRKEKSGGTRGFTWNEFVQFMKDSIMDPVNRTTSAVEELDRCQQREDQTVQQFVSYLESRLDECQVYDDYLKRNYLLPKLRRALRAEVKRQAIIPKGYEALIALATRLDNNLRGEDFSGEHLQSAQARSHGQKRERSKSPKSLQRNNSHHVPRTSWRDQRKGKPSSYRRASSANRTPLGPPMPILPDLSKIQCYTCKEMGHFATTCPRRVGPVRERPQVRCYNCDQLGHTARDCRNAPKAEKGDRR